MPFGVAAAIGGAVASTAAAVGITVGATAATAIGAGIVGAGVGAIGSAVTGGDPLTGALTGGLSGGLASGFGGALAGATGLSSQVAGGLLGAAGGALGSAIGGGNPLIGAIGGGAYGYGLGSNNWGAGAGANTGGFPTSDSYASGLQSGVANPVAASDLAGAAGANGVANAITQAAGPVAGNAASTAGGLSKMQLLAGLANAVTAMHKPEVSTQATPGPNSVQMSPYQTMGLSTAPVPGREAVDPSSGNVNAYGVTGSGVNPGGPEQTYFKNNSLAAYSPGGVGLAEGGALTKEFTTAAGNNRHVRGPGTATSDSIPAMLSNGEYVLDHKDVSLIGHGNNEKGAKMLDHSRRLLNQGDRTGALNALAA